MLVIDGLEKPTLLRFAHFHIYLEVLIECGAFIFCVYRYIISMLSIISISLLF